MKGPFGCALLVGAVLVGIAPAAEERAGERGAPSPWLHRFQAQRVLYVSPDGTGSGASAETPMGLKAAVEASLPGDTYCLTEGRYRGGFDLTRNGEREKPIVYRAAPGQRATIVGPVSVLGGYTWLWGIEFIDPEPLKPGARYTNHAIRVGAPGAHLINNIIHNCGGGIGGWMGGADNVLYGNIIYGMGGDEDRPQNLTTNYPTYTQSDYDKDGYKYWVQNMFFDGTAQNPSGGFNFHGYTQEGAVSGFYLKQNLFVNGQMIIGSTKRPPHHNVVIQNCFYHAMRARLGFSTPTQAEFRDNYLVQTSLDVVEFPGDGEKKHPMPLPTVVTGNEIYEPTWAGSHVFFRTSAWLDGAELSRGTPRIKADDVWDRNTYSEPVRIAFHAGGENLGIDSARKTPGPLDLAAWQARSEAVGNRFDAHSRAVPRPAEPRVFLFANEYEPGRGHVIIYNWTKADRVSVDLSPILTRGASYIVHQAKRPFDKPVLEGKFEAPVSLPLESKEFGAFLVRTVSARAGQPVPF